MNEIQKKAITHQLKSEWPDPENKQPFTLWNRLDIPVVAILVDSTGQFMPMHFGLGPGNTGSSPPVIVGSWVVWVDGYTHKFVAVTKFEDPAKAIVIDQSMVLQPGDIGPIPTPNADIILPDDSTPVVVGFGKTPSSCILRTQFYHCTESSYCLAPGETRNIGVSTMNGTQSITSDMETVSSSLNTSASAGWGPVSASVSFSLNQSSTTFQQYTITTETASYDQITLDNSQSKEAMMFFTWQMIDQVTVFSLANALPLSIISSARVPLVVEGPYDPQNLDPAPEPKGEFSAAARALSESWSEQ